MPTNMHRAPNYREQTRAWSMHSKTALDDQHTLALLANGFATEANRLTRSTTCSFWANWLFTGICSNGEVSAFSYETRLELARSLTC